MELKDAKRGMVARHKNRVFIAEMCTNEDSIFYLHDGDSGKAAKYLLSECEIVHPAIACEALATEIGINGKTYPIERIYLDTDLIVVIPGSTYGLKIPYCNTPFDRIVQNFAGYFGGHILDKEVSNVFA